MSGTQTLMDLALIEQSDKCAQGATCVTFDSCKRLPHPYIGPQQEKRLNLVIVH